MSDDENRSSTSADNAENEQEVAEGDDGAGPVPVDTDPLSATPGSMVNTLSRFPNLTVGSLTRSESETPKRR